MQLPQTPTNQSQHSETQTHQSQPTRPRIQAMDRLRERISQGEGHREAQPQSITESHHEVRGEQEGTCYGHHSLDRRKFRGENQPFQLQPRTLNHRIMTTENRVAQEADRHRTGYYLKSEWHGVSRQESEDSGSMENPRESQSAAGAYSNPNYTEVKVNNSIITMDKPG